MEWLLDNPALQYGALGLSFVLTYAFVRAFFLLMQQRQAIQDEILQHHTDREQAFTDQFLACIDRNSGALEKVEEGLHQLRVQIAERQTH